MLNITTPYKGICNLITSFCFSFYTFYKYYCKYLINYQFKYCKYLDTKNKILDDIKL